MNLEFIPQPSLQAFNTFGIAVSCQQLCQLKQLDQLPELLASPAYQQGPVLWLGGGSNVLFVGDFPGLVVQVQLKGITVLQQDQDSVLVEVAAGEVWHEFVLYALSQGWYGLENLSLIPGSVGACPMQNIGAYGVEVQEWISEVVCADLTRHGQSRVLSQAACEFGYRDSIFKRELAGKVLITAVRFRLKRRFEPRSHYGDIQQELAAMGVAQPSAIDISRAVVNIRQRKLPDPAILGNAGSFFKNPIVSQAQAQALLEQYPQLPHYPATPGFSKLAAGWLIDQCGLKGYRQGDVGVHTQQALVLVNYGAASGLEIKQLAERIQATVWQRFAVALEQEPLLVGA